MDELVQFVRGELDEEVERAREFGNAFIRAGAAQLHIPPGAAERQVEARVRAAEVRRQLFEETVLPYLGTAGPTGRTAEQQLRLFAVMYADRRGYREEWRP